MKDKEIEYLIELGFDIKSPFDSEAVAMIMKTYLESQNKEAKEALDYHVKNRSELTKQLADALEMIKIISSERKIAKEHWDIAVNDVNRLEGEVKELKQKMCQCDVKVYALFFSMIEDIPKHLREKHQKKVEWLEEKGFIKPFDLGG